MNNHYSTLFKISFTTLYLLALLARPTRTAPEDDFHQPFLSLYYDQIDNYVARLMNNPFTSMVEFQKTLVYTSHSGQILAEKEGALSKLNKLIADSKEALGNLSNAPKEEIAKIQFMEGLSQSQQSSLTELQLVVPGMRVTPRYNNVDSFIWNSIVFDLNQDLEDVQRGTSPGSHFFYPSSKISMPNWKVLGESMNLWMVPHHHFNYEFIAVSAPVHASLQMSTDQKLPKVVNLNNRTSSDLKTLNPNMADMNMAYFFKMMVDRNVHMVVAICSDPELESTDDQDSFKFRFSENLSVMNKCHLYWRVQFDMVFNGKRYSVLSEVREDEATDLYRVYLLTISAQDGDFQHQVRIYVLSEWPDHEKLPEEMIDSQLQLYDIMYRRLNPLENAQREHIMIHCSAGVGRTGTTILGYQMYAQLRMVTALNLLNPSTTFYSFIQKYKRTAYAQNMIQGVSSSVLSANSPDMKASPQDNKNLGQLIQVFTNSKLIWYLLDSLFYYRCRRMWFVQTVDQFEFLIKFAQILDIQTIQMHTSSAGSLLSTEEPDQMEEIANVYNPMFRQHQLKLVHQDKKPQMASESGQNRTNKQQSSVKDSQKSTLAVESRQSKVQKSQSSIEGTSKPIEKKSVTRSQSQKDQKTEEKVSKNNSTMKVIGGISMSKEHLDKLKSKLSHESVNTDLRLI